MPGLWKAALGRPSQFIFLAFALAFANTYATTIAASSFLANAGIDRLPLYYILFSLISIPLSIGFSGIIDRWPRPRIFLAMLAILVAEGVILPLLPLVIDALTAEFISYVGFSVCELMLYSVYYVLFSDYFTATEANRYTTPVAMGMAMGGIAGAALVGGIAQILPPGAAAILVPVLAGLVLAHAAWLTRREEPLDEIESAREDGIWDSLRILPSVARRYPIIGFMVAAVFLNILLQCMAEFAAFSIYTEHYPDEAELTAFLGFANAGINILGVVIVLAFTNPLLPRLGVARMNLCVPLFNILSFGVLAVSGTLPAGILSHINYDSFENNAGVPVFSMNYNAVPHRFVGRIRVFNDGAIYPLALAVSGLLLIALDGVLPLSGLALLCVAASIGFLGVAWGIKRHYVQGLLEMLRSGSIDLSRAGKGFIPPPEYLDDIRAMLDGDDADSVALGLEMAMRCDLALAFARAEDCLARLPAEQGRRLLDLFLAADRAATIGLLGRLTRSPRAFLRRLALEILGARTLPPGKVDLDALRTDPDETIRCMAALLSGASLPTAPLSSETALAAITICPSLDDAAAAAVAAGLRRHADTRVRAAALATLIRVSPTAGLDELAAAGLGDAAPAVRRAVAQALGRRGAEALDAAAAQLRAPSPATCQAAMEALGLIGSKAADAALFAFLEECVHPRVEQALDLLRRLPRSEEWAILRLALEDANAQALTMVLNALAAMGYQRILGVLKTALAAADPRAKSNALEALASLSHRRYVLPLMPLLEGRDDDDAPPASPEATRRLLDDALASANPWVRAAARLLTPGAAHDDKDPTMNRLAFLKSISLFSELTLDNLVALDGVMTRETYLPGEAIVTEGDSGDRLYIIVRGTVAIRKTFPEGMRELARLGQGQVFGEMSIFDSETRSATVAALDETEVLSLEQDHLNSLIQQRPEISVEFCKVLARRLRQAFA